MNSQVCGQLKYDLKVSLALSILVVRKKCRAVEREAFDASQSTSSLFEVFAHWLGMFAVNISHALLNISSCFNFHVDMYSQNIIIDKRRASSNVYEMCPVEHVSADLSTSPCCLYPSRAFAAQITNSGFVTYI